MRLTSGDFMAKCFVLQVTSLLQSTLKSQASSLGIDTMRSGFHGELTSADG